jgi:hypothetical protein
VGQHLCADDQVLVASYIDLRSRVMRVFVFELRSAKVPQQVGRFEANDR